MCKGIMVRSSSHFSDPVLINLHQRVVTRFGELPPIQPVQPEKYFGQLAESIIGQQLSNKVADVIVARVLQTVSDQWVPEVILTTDVPVFRAAGLSNAKAQYLKNVALAWVEQKIIPEKINTLSDEEVITELIKVKGVGRWTAEMFLIFTLGRPDVFSVGDYGLRKAIATAYNIEVTAKPAVFLELTAAWQPQRSLASRVLWKSLELPKAIPLTNQ